jgi:hypothetical protein
MANFDPVLRRETWLFQEIGQQPKGKVIYRCLPYMLVSYDNDPVQYVEPRPADDFVNVSANDGTTTGNAGRAINPSTDGLGRVGGIQFVTRRPFEVFAYNDVDAATNIGQLSEPTEKKMPSYAG